MSEVVKGTTAQKIEEYKRKKRTYPANGWAGGY